MLFGQNARRQIPGRVALQDRHDGLRDDRAVVHLRPHEVDGTAGKPHARLDGPLVGVKTLERRQNAGVDIDQPVPPPADEAAGQQPHEPGITDKLDGSAGKRRVERILERLTALEVPMIDGLGRYARLDGPFETGSIRYVGDDEGDLCP